MRYRYENYKTVGQFMSTDLYTVHPGDLVDLVASIMHWQRIHHVLVEDENHQLVGLVSQRDLLQLLAQGSNLNRAHAPVSVVMKRNPITVTPETKTADAIEIMRENRVGCLPVVKGNRLVGRVDVYDILSVSSAIFEMELRKLMDL
jgi:CBS domain-containing protein